MDYEEKLKLVQPKFEERYKTLLGERYEKFIEFSLSARKRAIRINTLKISVAELKKRLSKDWLLTEVPWCKEGFLIKHKRDDEKTDIGNMIEHQLGYFYIQDPASMIPPIVLDPKPGDTVLDMCAAPGSKATQISQFMQNQGTLVANDSRGIRLAALGINIQRMGITNCVITLMEGVRFRGFQFDKILLDAPCSGTGTIRKSTNTLKEWSPGLIKHIATQQKRLMDAAFCNLKPGGTLVYSTCSLEPEENEGIISYLLSKYPDAKIEQVSLNGLKTSQPVMEFEGTKYNSEVSKCLRIWPQDNDTEGFFVTKIKKI